jgi:hypothetical protein
MRNTLRVAGHFWGRIDDVNGKPRQWLKAKNGITLVALNDLLTVYFLSGTQKASWFGGLIGDPATLNDTTDTIASHADWTEFTAYSEGARQTWTPGIIAGGIINNPAPMKVTISTGGILKGAFLVSDNTKGGTTGILWATGFWDTDVDQIVVPGEAFTFGYLLKAANG